MWSKDGQHTRKLYYSRVRLCVQSCNPYNLIVKFSISITTTKLWESNYSEYQQYLFNRICEYKENNVTPIGYRKISKIFNQEGLKTLHGNVFKNNHVHSIYKKGKIREERISREDIVEISQVTIEELK
ncbi:hypothetical protein N9525_04605 [Flavobacteriaceae bacterium]|nr:hypothetical protein [Flavobacteriaceae bacterium]